MPTICRMFHFTNLPSAFVCEKGSNFEIEIKQNHGIHMRRTGLFNLLLLGKIWSQYIHIFTISSLIYLFYSIKCLFLVFCCFILKNKKIIFWFFMYNNENFTKECSTLCNQIYLVITTVNITRLTYLIY